MEKKQTTTVKNNNKKNNIFGNTALQLNDVEASCMVGGIVEKGFSDNPVSGPIAPPRPTVLHFPVARHRSEGPVSFKSLLNFIIAVKKEIEELVVVFVTALESGK